ncbi:MAG: orotidine-5'-phosphate decarboxylase [Sedimentisphaerales bacterium]
MKHFSDKLLEAIEVKGNPICVGLDPRLNLLPAQIMKDAFHKFGKTGKAAGYAIETFNKVVIDVICDIVPIVKPQMAFYEAYGDFGIRAFINTVDYAHSKGLIVIEDAKRNDIGSTAKAYASGHLGKVECGPGTFLRGLDVDAITINAYLGYDGIKPFIEQAISFNKGVFILVKTSNPSSSEIQNLILSEPFQGILLYERIALLVDEWGRRSLGDFGFSDIGAVVGATFPVEAAKLRKLMPHTLFLVPGYGAQGAHGKDVVQCFNTQKKGAIISSSRQIIYAFRDKEDKEKELTKGSSFADCIRSEALEMCKDIQSALHASGKGQN